MNSCLYMFIACSSSPSFTPVSTYPFPFECEFSQVKNSKRKKCIRPDQVFCIFSMQNSTQVSSSFMHVCTHFPTWSLQSMMNIYTRAFMDITAFCSSWVYVRVYVVWIYNVHVLFIQFKFHFSFRRVWWQ